MKKISLLLIIAFAIFGCKKESNEQMQEAPDNNNTETLILCFKQKLENHLKDGSTYATDSAVWYVEALLNYTYGNAGVICRDFNVDTVETPVNATGANGFTLAQLAQVFDVIETGVLAHQPEGTHIFAIDLYTYPAGNLTVFAARTAYATPTAPAYKALADTSGYWYWGAEQGMCGSDSGLYIGMDATDIIEDLINNTVQGDYFTDLETNSVSYWDNYIDPNFPFDIQYLLPRRLFAADGPFEETLFFCTSPSLIAYYASNQGIGYIINDLKPVRKEFAYGILTGGTPDNLLVIHNVGITYGTPQ